MEMGTHDPGKRIRTEYPDVFLVPGPNGGIVRPNYRPERSAEDDRDSSAPSRLASLYRHMDRRVDDMRRTRSTSAKVQIAEDLAATWREIKEIMGDQG